VVQCSNIVHEFVERVCVAALAIPSPSDRVFKMPACHTW